MECESQGSGCSGRLGRFDNRGLGSKAAHVQQHFRDKLIEHRNYVDRHGEDMPEIQNWSWPYKTAARVGDKG